MTSLSSNRIKLLSMSILNIPKRMFCYQIGGTLVKPTLMQATVKGQHPLSYFIRLTSSCQQHSCRSRTNENQHIPSVLIKDWNEANTICKLPSSCLLKCSYSNHTSFTDKTFTVIYRFPYIVHTRLLSRLKIYQTLLTIAAVPWCYSLHSSGQISDGLYTAVITYSVVACVMLYALSIYFRRIIGIIYYNETNNIVKVSHLTFWGTRKDIYVPVQNIVPLSDFSEDPNNIFVKLRQYDTKNELYLVLKFGGIKDGEKLRYVLGEIK